MLCAILALIAAGCFVFMVVAILISLQLSDKLHRAERELERRKRISVEDRPTLWRVKYGKGMLYRKAKMPTRDG
jgi:hypothetical protein